MSSLEDAQELYLADFAKIATGFEGYIFLSIFSRSAIATLLVDSTPDGMMRAVVSCHLATGVLPKDPTTPPDGEQEGLSCEAFDNIRNTDGVIDETLIQEELQNLTREYNLAPMIAPVVTRKGKQRMLQSDHSPSPQETRQPPPTAPPGEMPPPRTPVAPPPRTQTRKQKDQRTPDPMFPTQETAMSIETALSHEHRGPYPTMVQRTVGLFHKPQELMKQQREDSYLLENIHDLDNGGTGGGICNRRRLTSPVCTLRFHPTPSFPRFMVSDILALVHITYGHSGVARTTELMQRKYY